MQEPPLYIFLENVPGFETSQCHLLLLQVLKDKNYQIEEYMVMPTDPAVHIPNRRRRYYLSAKRLHLRSLVDTRTSPDQHVHLETCVEIPFIQDRLITSFEEIGITSSSNLYEPRLLSDYHLTSQDDISELMVPLDFISSAKDFRFDIVNPTAATSTNPISCATFTKAYGSKYVIGTGSFIQTKMKDLYAQFEPDDQSILPLLGLRFFSPMEIEDLHAFPIIRHGAPHNTIRQTTDLEKAENKILFQFPDGLSLKQKWRLLGNSLNVRVVALLLSRLLDNHSF